MAKNRDNNDAVGQQTSVPEQDMTFQDKIIDMVAPSHLNIYRYIGTPVGYENHKLPHDGLVRAPIGFYRLAEDTENGNRVLLFSNEPESLAGQNNGQETRRLSSDMEHSVYVIAARENIRDTRWVQEEIIKHQNDLQNWRLKHLNLYVESENMRADEDIQQEAADTAKPDPKACQVIKMSNSNVGYGLFEQEDGSWNVSLYAGDAPNTEEAQHFVAVSDDPTFDNFFALRHDMGNFETLDDANRLVAHDFQKRAYRLWNGQAPVSASDSPRLALQRRLINLLKAPAQKGWLFKASVPLFAAAAVGGIGFLMTGGAIAATGAAAAISGLATAGLGLAANHFAEQVVEQGLKKLVSEKSQEEKNKTLPKHERKKAFEYTQEIGQRLSPRLSADKAGNLRPLNDREAGIRPPLSAPSLFMSDHYAEEWLFGGLSGAFGAIVFPVNEHSFSVQYPNGIVSLYNTEKRSVHVRMRPDLRVRHPDDDVPDPPLPQRVAEMLKDGEIVRVAMGQNGFDSGRKTRQEFADEIKEIIRAPVAQPDGSQKRPDYVARKRHLKSYSLQSIKELFSREAAPDFAQMTFIPQKNQSPQP